MELRKIALTLWKWAWLIVLATAVAAVSSWWVVRGQPPVYRTSTTLMVGLTIQEVSPDYSEFYTAQQLAQTYSELIKREPVLRATARELGFEEEWRNLQGQVSAALVAGTQLMEISVVDTDPIRAKRIADEIARQLIATVEATRPQGTSREFIEAQVSTLPAKVEAAQKEIAELEAELGQTFSAREIQDLQSRINTLEGQVNNWRSTFADYQLLLGDTGVNVLTVVEEARLPTHPVGSQGRMQVMLAAAIGLMLAVGAAFLIEYLDDTVKTPEDVERKTGLPTLGSIIRYPGTNGEGPLTALEPRSAVAEGYRVLRTNLQFAAMGVGKSRQPHQEGEAEYRPGVILLVTSAQPSEGKTSSVANLGVSLAQAGHKVLLVDGDLRRPTLHRLFNLSKEAGLTSLLLEREADIEHVIQKTKVDGLRVLPSGPVPANPAEVLGFVEMGTLLERLRTMADYVLLDAPPVLSAADTSVLAQKVDGSLLVVEAGRTRTEMFERAVAVLQRVKARVLGAILTKVGLSRSTRSYDYYYYYSNYYDEEEGVHKRRVRPGPEGLVDRLQSGVERLGLAIGGLFGRRPQARAETSDHERHPAGRGSNERVEEVPAEVATAPRLLSSEVAMVTTPQSGVTAFSGGAPLPVSGEVAPAAAEVEAMPEVVEVAAEVAAFAAPTDGAPSPLSGELPPAAAEVEVPPEVPEAMAEVSAEAAELEALPEAKEVIAAIPAGVAALEVEAPPEVAEVIVGVPAVAETADHERHPAGRGSNEMVEEVAVEAPIAQEAESPPETPDHERHPAGRGSNERAEEVAVEVPLLAATVEVVPPAAEPALAGAAVRPNVLYARAMEHYRSREWPRALDELLRLKAADPARPGLDALIDDVEQFMKSDREGQRAARPEAAPIAPPGVKGRDRRSRMPLWQAIALALLLLSVAGGALAYAGVIQLPSLTLPFLDNRVQTYINRGYDSFTIDDYQAAMDNFNRALELDPDNEEAKLGLQHARQYLDLNRLYAEARALMEQKSFDEAITRIQAIIAVDPWYKDADLLLQQCENAKKLEDLYKQALSYYSAGDWSKAVDAFEALQGKGVAAGEEEVRSQLFDSYLNEGQQQVAAADSRSAIIRATLSFNSALALFPDDEKAQKERQLASLYLDGYTAYERADWRQAAGYLARLCAERADYAEGQAARLLCESYTKQGDAYQASGQLQSALDQYRLVQAVAQCDQTEVSAKIQALLAPTPTPAAAS